VCAVKKKEKLKIKNPFKKLARKRQRQLRPQAALHTNNKKEINTKK